VRNELRFKTQRQTTKTKKFAPLLPQKTTKTTEGKSGDAVVENNTTNNGEY
jgi:hypothetical protein